MTTLACLNNMYFILGFIVGIIVAGLIFVILAFFRAGIEKRIKVIETVLARAGPKVKGYIFEPEDEADELRKQRIKENSEAGRSTTLEELRNQ